MKKTLAILCVLIASACIAKAELTTNCNRNVKFWYYSVQGNTTAPPEGSFGFGEAGKGIHIRTWDVAAMGAAYPGDAVINSYTATSAVWIVTFEKDEEAERAYINKAIVAVIKAYNQKNPGNKITKADYKAAYKSLP